MKIKTAYLSFLPVLISSTLAALWVWYNHALHESTALFLGIIAGGLVELDDRFTGRLRNLFFTLLHFSLASLAVQLALPFPWLFAALMVFAAFCVTMAGVIDVRYRTITFGTLLVMLYTAMTYRLDLVWYLNPMMLVCGTLLYTLCTICLHILFPHYPAQESLAEACRKLADYMMIKAQFFDPDEADFLHEKEIKLAMSNAAVTAAFNQCRSTLFYRLRSQHRHARTIFLLQYYLAIQNIHERISSRHTEYSELANQLAHSDLLYRIQRLIVLQAQACRNVGEALHRHAGYIHDSLLTRAEHGLKRAFSVYLLEHGTAKNTPYLQQILDNILSVSEQLQRLENIKLNVKKTNEIDETIAGQDVDNLRDIIPTLRKHLNFESSVFRHAVRMSMMSALICVVVTLFQLHMGYWILMTALLVCQPNYSATTTRLKQRVWGTVLGVLVGSALVYIIPSFEGKLLITVISTTLFLVLRRRRYGFSTFFITIQVLVGFGMMGLNTQETIYPRILDTLLGSGIAWCAVSYLWPDWRYLTLSKTAMRALQGNAAYLRQVLAQMASGSKDDVAYRLARRTAHENAAALSNTVSNMSIEPKKYQQQLPTAFTLLQLNYALISSISTLGTFRHRMDEERRQHHGSGFWPRFFDAGAQSIQVMTQNFSETQDVQATLNRLAESVQAIKPDDENDHANKQIVWAQLKRISEKLQLYANILLSKQANG
ncbi:YccS family putative transporter [Stenoxybacter acetivorans]|uniref:YccS family putative transporter n=1 Tax=Stenoxybacter acetivorans TaxID=422441 RepID=UPI000565D003|nr:YccS family putative transporter [Stenoxybacter acetivorans]